MKFTLIFVLFVTFTSNLWAHGKKMTAHREHGAHAHGVGKLGLAFDGVNGKLDFKIPSESVVGFEYAAKTEKDKKKQSVALAKFEANLSSMIVFDPDLKCQLTKERLEVVAESKKSKHSDLLAVYNVKCAKSPLETVVTFNFKKIFNKIKEVEVEAIVENVQKAIEVKGDGTKLMLGR